MIQQWASETPQPEAMFSPSPVSITTEEIACGSVTGAPSVASPQPAQSPVDSVTMVPFLNTVSPQPKPS